LDRSGNLAALEDGESTFRYDLLTDAKHFRDGEYLGHGFRSSAVVPLVSQGKVVGSLALRSKRPGAYGPREQSIITRLANQVAPAVENAILQEQAQDSELAHRQLAGQLAARNEEIALVDRLADIISSSSNIDDVYEYFSQELQSLIKFDRIVVNHIDTHAGVFTTRFVSGVPVPGREQGSKHELKGTIPEKLVRSGKPIVRSDLRVKKIVQSDEIFKDTGLVSSVAFPMISNNGIIATLHVHSLQEAAFGHAEKAILERLAAQITPAIANGLLMDALVRGEARNRALLEKTSDAIITINETGIIQSFNPSAAAMFGYSSDEIV
jgi:GAF domain-containing protein